MIFRIVRGDSVYVTIEVTSMMNYERKEREGDERDMKKKRREEKKGRRTVDLG